MKGRAMLAALVGCLVQAMAVSPSAAAEACAGAQTAKTGKLTVQVNGVSPVQGQVAVTVYPDDRRRFLAPAGKLLRQRVTAKGAVASACFWLPAGSYAIAVYHDANANRDFDRKLTGMPAEGYGFSNDPSTQFGLPSLDKVRFQLSGADAMVAVRLHYRR